MKAFAILTAILVVLGASTITAAISFYTTGSHNAPLFAEAISVAISTVWSIAVGVALWPEEPNKTSDQ